MSLYLNFRGTFKNSGRHTKSFNFLPFKLNSYPEISVHFLFKFELDVDSFGSGRGADDSEVVSAIALVLNSRNICGKIAGIRQCRALGTTLILNFFASLSNQIRSHISCELFVCMTY